MAVRISNPIHQHFTKGSITRAPLSRGQLFFYEPGTTTDKDVYSDEDATTAYTNPIALDDIGFEPDIWGIGAYRVVLKSSVDTSSRLQSDRTMTLSDRDDAFSLWKSTTTYSAGGNNIVTFSGKFYISIQAGNLNQAPSTQAAFWTKFHLLKQWNTNETYGAGSPIIDINIYYTAIDTTTGDTPATSPTKWRRHTTKVTIQKFTADGTWTKPTGVTHIIVEVIGGGGGGAGCLGQPSGGGGGGGYSRVALDAIALTTETVTVGEGGTGGATGANDGNAGESSSFGTLCVATAGAAGIRSIADGGAAAAAAGGIGTTGDILAAGDSGDPNNGSHRHNGGGNSVFGAGAVPQTTGDGNGVNGRNFGGGGGAGNRASSNTVGGDGADGIVIVTEFIGG